MLWLIPIFYVIVVFLHKFWATKWLRWGRWGLIILHLFVWIGMMKEGVWGAFEPAFLFGSFALFVVLVSFMVDLGMRYPEVGAGASWVGAFLAFGWVLSLDLPHSAGTLMWKHLFSLILGIGLSFFLSAVLWLWRLHLAEKSEAQILFRSWRTLQLLALFFLALAVGLNFWQRGTFEPAKDYALWSLALVSLPLLFPVANSRENKDPSTVSLALLSWSWGIFALIFSGIFLFFAQSL